MSERRILTTAGTERVLDDSVIDNLAVGLRGELLRPSDRGYEGARVVWNGMVDKRPALIARCAGTADVVDCVRFAREHDLLVSVRGGGHNYAGKSVCDGGLMIDLSPLKGIYVDPARRTARAQAGLRLGEFDRETQAFGLATTLGINTDTGIAGLTLGGGYGWLNGKHGLACDNLLSVEMVTADGRVVTASAEENEDLYWGVRGAGANLGIVTSFEYRLHPVGLVLGGMLLYPIGKGREALQLFDEFSATCPDEVSTNGLLMTAPNGEPAVGIAVCYCGPLDQGEKVLKPVRTVATPLADLIAPQPYVQMQTVFDEVWPPGRRYYQKSSVVRRLAGTGDRDAHGPGSFHADRPVGHRVPAGSRRGESRRGERDGIPAPLRSFQRVRPSGDGRRRGVREDRSLGRDAWEALQPFAERAVYVNALEDAIEEGEHRVREAYGPNYERLVALKEKYDPTNFFRVNQNVKPT